MDLTSYTGFYADHFTNPVISRKEYDSMFASNTNLATAKNTEGKVTSFRAPAKQVHVGMPGRIMGGNVHHVYDGELSDEAKAFNRKGAMNVYSNYGQGYLKMYHEAEAKTLKNVYNDDIASYISAHEGLTPAGVAFRSYKNESGVAAPVTSRDTANKTRRGSRGNKRAGASTRSASRASGKRFKGQQGSSTAILSTAGTVLDGGEFQRTLLG